MTTSVSPTLTQAEQIAYDLFWKPMIDAGKAALFVAVPELNAPILGTIDNAIIDVISNVVFNQLRLFIDVTEIKFVSAAHMKAYTTENLKLALIAKQDGVNSNAYQTEKAVSLQTLSVFLRMPGS